MTTLLIKKRLEIIKDDYNVEKAIKDLEKN